VRLTNVAEILYGLIIPDEELIAASERGEITYGLGPQASAIGCPLAHKVHGPDLVPRLWPRLLGPACFTPPLVRASAGFKRIAV
jgi:hypothetical protein